ncbi:MAG: HU domain-containing protein [Mucilaginibacter sp.]
MDLAVYISELLGLQGEVNVPGLGRFAQVRVNGYFNEQENKFYPPSHEVNFEPKSDDADDFAKYISDKKNISLASSKYFIDKYVIGVRQQADTQNVEVAGLGHLFADGAVLGFKANNSTRADDPAFYGFAPVKIDKITERPAVTSVPPVREEVKEPNEPLPVVEDIPVHQIPEEIIVKEPDPVEDVFIPQEQEEEQQEVFYDEPQQGVNPWVITLLIIIGVILAATGVYIYKPAVFDRFLNKKTVPVVIKHVDSTVVKPDTTIKSAPKQDTAAKVVTTAQPATSQPPNIIDSTKTRFEVMGGSFETRKTADLAIKNYKSLGIDAKVVTDAPGRRIKLTLGTYSTEQEAENAKQDLIKTGKVKKDIYTLKINPKK